MFGKVKKILGIEGVKIELLVPEVIQASTELIKGKLKISSLTDQTIKEIELKLVEKYTRGRKTGKLIDEYTIGNELLDEPIDVQKNQVLMLDFELPFRLLESEMDKIQNSNFLKRGLVKLAKYAKGVKSEFKITADAKVTGTKLQPTVTKAITLK